MMPASRRYPVRIRIVSQADDERLEQTVSGVAYRKARGWYLHYEERDEAGDVLRTIVRMTGEEWVITRRGAVNAELRFVRGTACPGRYRIGGMELPLTTRLHEASLDIEEGRGTVRLAYALSIGGEPERDHSVTYRLEPEAGE